MNSRVFSNSHFPVVKRVNVRFRTIIKTRRERSTQPIPRRAIAVRLLDCNPLWDTLKVFHCRRFMLPSSMIKEINSLRFSDIG